MAIIYREIESFKTLKKALKKSGINRFNSILEINFFIKQYDNEKLKIIENTKSEINQDVISKRDRLKNNKIELKVLVDNLTNNITDKIKKDSKKLTELNTMHSNVIFSLINKLWHYLLTLKTTYLNENFDKIIQNKSKKLRKIILTDQSSIEYIINNKEKELLKRSKKAIDRLTYIDETLKELYPLVSGAVGESLVVEEVEKLSDDFILINDFNLKFKKPIYNKSKGKRIYSIQIDHLLISPAGIFIIETKNWSKASLNNYNLRSPVEQIHRSSYALFVIINNIKKLRKIGRHHWGENQIVLRNLIVMTYNKPKTNFKFVKILKLNELNGYISYFDKLYSENDVNRIADVLLNLVNRKIVYNN